MRTILFFARDPGGANSLIDIINACSEVYDCSVYAKDFACTSFTQTKIEYIEVGDENDFLARIKNYDLVFTGTSYGDDLEHLIWEKAQEVGVKCIAYLDHWMGYERFFNNKQEKYIFPQYLIVVDNIAKDYVVQKFSNHNFDVIALGSTFLEKLLDAALTKENLVQYKSKLNLTAFDEVIVYAAEKIKGYEAEGRYGFNEYQQFEKLYKYLLKQNKEIKLFFIPHPKHSRYEVELELSNIGLEKNKNITVTINTEYDKNLLVQVADKVFGINTMVLVEALIYKVPICSIHIGIQQDSDFQLIKKDIIFNADTDEKLRQFICNQVAVSGYEIKNIENSLSNMMTLINNMIDDE